MQHLSLSADLLYGFLLLIHKSTTDGQDLLIDPPLLQGQKIQRSGNRYAVLRMAIYISLYLRA